jgi:hypothetical protein
MQSSVSRRCAVSEWIQRNRLLPKSVPQQRPFLLRNFSPPGLVPVPGDEESAGVNYSHRSPEGNRHSRRLLNQGSNSAAKTKGSIFEIVYRRSVPGLGSGNSETSAIGSIHRILNPTKHKRSDFRLWVLGPTSASGSCFGINRFL